TIKKMGGQCVFAGDLNCDVIHALDGDEEPEDDQPEDAKDAKEEDITCTNAQLVGRLLGRHTEFIPVLDDDGNPIHTYFKQGCRSSALDYFLLDEALTARRIGSMTVNRPP